MTDLLWIYGGILFGLFAAAVILACCIVGDDRRGLNG